MAGDRHDIGFVYASCRHALVLGFEKNRDALRLQRLRDRVVDLCGQALLILQTPRMGFHNARQFGYSDKARIRNIRQMRIADKRRDMVLAMGFDLNVLKKNHILVRADLIETFLEIIFRVLPIAAEKLLIALHNAPRRVAQILALRIIARPCDERAHRLLRLRAAGARLLFGRRAIHNRFDFVSCSAHLDILFWIPIPAKHIYRKIWKKPHHQLSRQAHKTLSKDNATETHKVKLKLYNTRSRRKEAFAPAHQEGVTMYVCGPTVYAPPHIGNARSAVVFDVLARLLRHLYPKLIYARNITDIDDNITEAAKRENCSIGAISKRYEEAYHCDMEQLHVLPPDREPKATEHIAQIQEMIRRLLEKGHAYEAEGHVLFHVPSWHSYGSLSGRKKEEMQAGARVEVAPYKKDAADFVLWKPSEEDDPGWESPWGRGRPGWHIECSAMIKAALGKTIDIHGAGEDLIFPHNENEEAQSMSVHGGAPLARFWVHNAFVRMRAEKMSKSEGNVVLLPDILKKNAGETVRYALLSTHYRQPLDWSPQSLPQAKRALDRFYRRLSAFEDIAPAPEPPQEMMEALCDDMNVPAALGTLASLARRKEKAAASSLLAGGALLGILQESPRRWLGESSGGEADQEIEALIRARDAAKKNRDFAEADRIREALEKDGIHLEDAKEGTRWYRSGKVD